MKRFVGQLCRRVRGKGGWKGWVRLTLAFAFIVLVLLPAVIVAIYRVVPVPATPLMVIRLFEGEGWSRDWVPLNEISPHLPKAVIAAEDNRFCEHHGFDFQAIQQVIEEAQAGRGLRGASTISMQTAKNLLLWDGRNVVRKGLEALFTPLIEILWPKTRIMEVYLNVAEWAPGVYGAEAAARHHFGVPAAKLSQRQAALLAAVLPSPRRWSAGQPSGAVAGRASTIQRRIGQLGPMLDCVALDQ